MASNFPFVRIDTRADWKVPGMTIAITINAIPSGDSSSNFPIVRISFVLSCLNFSTSTLLSYRRIKRLIQQTTKWKEIRVRTEISVFKFSPSEFPYLCLNELKIMFNPLEISFNVAEIRISVLKTSKTARQDYWPIDHSVHVLTSNDISVETYAYAKYEEKREGEEKEQKEMIQFGR